MIAPLFDGARAALLEDSLPYKGLPIYICFEVTFVCPVFSSLTPRT
jgi:hypothetical protein